VLRRVCKLGFIVIPQATATSGADPDAGKNEGRRKYYAEHDERRNHVGSKNTDRAASCFTTAPAWAAIMSKPGCIDTHEEVGLAGAFAGGAHFLAAAISRSPHARPTPQFGSVELGMLV
jgi:hypothetical protein